GADGAFFVVGSVGFHGSGSGTCGTGGNANGGLTQNGAFGPKGRAGGFLAGSYWYAFVGGAGGIGQHGTGGGGGGGSGGCDNGTDSHGAGGGGGSAGGRGAKSGGGGGGGGGGKFWGLARNSTGKGR